MLLPHNFLEDEKKSSNIPHTFYPKDQRDSLLLLTGTSFSTKNSFQFLLQHVYLTQSSLKVHCIYFLLFKKKSQNSIIAILRLPLFVYF